MKKIFINVTEQMLYLVEQDDVLKSYSISTATNGVGEIENTGQTPRGRHIISDKFGANTEINSVFVARQPTGEIYTDELGVSNPDRDWILSRIMWLDGQESGVNQGVNADGKVCDSKARYIYIHGTPDTEPMGVPMSHGCIRMRNDHVIELFDMVIEGTEVFIQE